VIVPVPPTAPAPPPTSESPPPRTVMLVPLPIESVPRPAVGLSTVVVPTNAGPATVTDPEPSMRSVPLPSRPSAICGPSTAAPPGSVSVASPPLAIRATSPTVGTVPLLQFEPVVKLPVVVIQEISAPRVAAIPTTTLPITSRPRNDSETDHDMARAPVDERTPGREQSREECVSCPSGRHPPNRIFILEAGDRPCQATRWPWSPHPAAAGLLHRLLVPFYG
jgi:hypothetical protein